jgi:hypothetical protein
MKSHKVLFINPVERISPQGRHTHTYRIGGAGPATVIKKQSQDDNVTSVFKFNVDNRKNKLITGLDEMMMNPYKGMTDEELSSKYNLSSAWQTMLPKIVNQVKISRQMDLEIRHGVEPDYYTSHIRYTMASLPPGMATPEPTFLQSLKLILYPRPNRLTDETPRGELLIQMVKNLKEIAQTKNEANSALHSWFISEENEAEIEKSKRRDIVEAATYKLFKLKHEYGSYRSYQMSIMLRDANNVPLLKGEVTKETVFNRLSSFVSDSSNKQLKNIQAFEEKYELLNNAKTIERFEIEYLVQQALNVNVLNISNGEYIWHSKAGTPNLYKIGTDHDKIVNMFLRDYETYNSEDTEVNNLYKDLFTEVSNKGIKFE